MSAVTIDEHDDTDEYFNKNGFIYERPPWMQGWSYFEIDEVDEATRHELGLWVSLFSDKPQWEACARCCRYMLAGLLPDPCLGFLPGVEFGCCGHGSELGYLAFSNGVVVRFSSSEVDGVPPSLIDGS